MFSVLAREGNRDVRRWVRSACSSAGNDFTQTIEASSTRNDAPDTVASFHLASRVVRHSTALVLVSVSASGFGPALAGMFEPTARRVRIEGVCHMPEGLAGLRTHRNMVEVLSRQSLQNSYSLLVFQSMSVYRKDRVFIWGSVNSFNNFQVSRLK